MYTNIVFLNLDSWLSQVSFLETWNMIIESHPWNKPFKHKNKYKKLLSYIKYLSCQISHFGSTLQQSKSNPLKKALTSIIWIVKQVNGLNFELFHIIISWCTTK
jgi:hypothetical protein